MSNFRTCTGSRTTRGRKHSRDNERSHVAFRTHDGVGSPKQFYFRGSIPGPHVPLSTLRWHPYGYKRMTRGQHGSLLLCCKRLSLSITHRFAPAHFAVGTALTSRPPHRSQRAELPHWAPTSGDDAQALLGNLPYPFHRIWQAGGFNVGIVSWLLPRFLASCPFRDRHIKSFRFSVRRLFC